MRNSIVVLIFIVFTSFDLSAKTSDLKGECKPKDWICILTRNENDKVEFYIQNQTPSGEYPFIIHFDFTTLDNFESDVPVPYRFISKGSSEPKKFLTISPIDIHKGRSYNSNIYVKAGDDSPQTSNLPYRLPFESSSRVGKDITESSHIPEYSLMRLILLFPKEVPYSPQEKDLSSRYKTNIDPEEPPLTTRIKRTLFRFYIKTGASRNTPI